MKKITLFVLCLLAIQSINAQTIAWSSDSEDYLNWGIYDNDQDGVNWGIYSGGGESFGFEGALFYSQSYDDVNEIALTPDNYLISPVFAISETAVTITFKMKAMAIAAGYPTEKFAVYVYDNDDDITPETLIYEEILEAGGTGSAKNITASIPASFAGKNVGLFIRHYDCTDQYELWIDDFEVSYSTTLSTDNNQLDIAGFYPNPVKDNVQIKTNERIDAISVTNQLGQRVMDIKKTGIINNTINLSGLAKGMYFLNIQVESKSQSIKIIKE